MKNVFEIESLEDLASQVKSVRGRLNLESEVGQCMNTAIDEILESSEKILGLMQGDPSITNRLDTFIKLAQAVGNPNSRIDLLSILNNVGFVNSLEALAPNTYNNYADKVLQQ